MGVACYCRTRRPWERQIDALILAAASRLCEDAVTSSSIGRQKSLRDGLVNRAGGIGQHHVSAWFCYPSSPATTGLGCGIGLGLEVE